MSVHLVRGQTVNLNALVRAKNDARTTHERLLDAARKDVQRNNLDALAYVIRHTA